MTQGRCRVGDIAITVNTDLPENAGTVVEVLATHVRDRSWGEDHGPLCLVRTIGARPLQFNLVVQGRWLRHVVREGVVPDNRLVPITPPTREFGTRKADELEAPQRRPA